MFGVRQHKKEDQRMRDSISSQLSGKGEEYLRRCTLKKPADKPEMFEPVEFSTALSQDQFAPVIEPGVQVDDSERVRTSLSCTYRNLHKAQIHSRATYVLRAYVECACSCVQHKCGEDSYVVKGRR